MTRALLVAVAFLVGGADLPNSAGEPIVARDSGAFRSASGSLSIEDEARFWNLIHDGTAGWLDAKQLFEVQSVVAESAPSERVLLLTGRPNTYLLVAEASKGSGGVRLTYSASWEDGVKSGARSGDWWNSITTSLAVLETSRTDCKPRLGSKDNAVMYLRVSRPGGSFDVITYGLPPAFPASVSEGSEISSCSKAFLSLQRLLEESATSALDASSRQSRPSG